MCDRGETLVPGASDLPVAPGCDETPVRGFFGVKAGRTGGPVCGPGMRP